MKLKKVILAGLSLFLLLGTAGCIKQKEEPVELTLMHGWGSTEDDHVAMRKIYMDYEKENPNVKLNLVSMPSGSELVRKVEDMLMVGDIPDLLFLGGAEAETVYDFMVEKNLALDLMPYIEENPQLKECLAPVNLSYWTTEEGKLYTVSDVLLLSGGYWYNKEIFEKAGIESLPETWEEFLQVCRKIKGWSDREGRRVKCLQMPSEAYLYLAGHMLAADQEETEEPIQSRKESTLPTFQRLDQLLIQLKDLYSFTIAENDYSYRDDTSSFNKGKSAMYINGSWAAQIREIFMENIQDVLLGKKEETAFLRELAEAREK